MSADPDRLPVVLCWHMHQPDYRGPGGREYHLPWVYLHGLKDYSDMAAHLEAQPEARAVVNFAPVLLEQIEDYSAQIHAWQASGRRIRDPLLAALAGPGLPLDASRRRELITACRKANRTHLIDRFPCLRELIDLADWFGRHHRADIYVNDQFLADLLVWYHLAWTGEHIRDNDQRIDSLQRKGRGYSLDDRRALVDVIGEQLQVELGPRGTGKSYAVQELSPYAALLTGPTTVANLFGHMNGKQKGMLMIWDVVGFDEVADLQKMPKEVITTLKTFCESGQFQRGQEAMAGYASIALFGNTQQPIDVMVQTGHLFAPMPDVIRDDMAFIDRLHFYLPGWEVPKMRNEHFTDHYGFVIDYLAEALRELRKHNFTEIIDHYFSLGSHLNARDRKAVRRTVSGLVKILHPHGQVSREDLAELLELALEGRRRVKEQLKKMGSFEYYQTSFSYLVNDSGEERFVGVAEQGGRDLISADPLLPGTLYAASVSGDGTVGLYRVEVSLSSGTGKLKLAGGVSGTMKESVNRAFSYLSANKTPFGVARELDTSDFHVEVIDLLGNRVEAEIGVAFFVAAYSALRKAPPQPALLVLGDLSIQGNIKPVRSLTEPLQVAMDNGGKRALIPIENKRQFLEVNADVLEQVDPVFFGDMRQAAFKALGLS